MGHVSEHFPWEKLGYSAWENFLELFLTIFPFVPFIPFPAHACSVKKGFIEYILDVRPCVGETDVRKRNFHYQGNHSIVRETHVQR